MRKAAQCTHGVGGCQLKARRGKVRAAHARRRSRAAQGASRRQGAAAQQAARTPARARTPAAAAATPARARGREAGQQRVEGIVSANRAGYGFLRVEGLKDSVFLPPPEMRGVMHGDRLRVKLARDATDRWSGTVEQVLERGVTAFLGTVEIQGRNAWVNAADRRLQLRCAVAPEDLQGRARR